MKKTLFLAHDPGGYNVIQPIYNRFHEEGLHAELYCLGPASVINSEYNSTESQLTSRMTQLIESSQLQMLVTGTSWGNEVEIRAIQLSKREGILTVSILDYWSHYAARFQNSLGEYAYPDIFIVMDELAKKEAINENVPSQIIKVLGHPGLDSYVMGDKSIKRVHKPEYDILFLSQPISLFYGNQLGYTEQSVLEDCVKVINANTNMRLFVKFHPKDDATYQEQYRSISVEGLLSNLIPKYDLIIGMSTMGLLHAILSGVPTISFQPDLIGQDFCIATKLQLIPLALDIESLSRAINNVFSSIIENPYKDKVSSEAFIWSDGRSTERIFSYLQGVIK